MKPQLNTALKFIGLLTIFALYSLAINLISNDLQQDIEGSLGGYYKLILYGVGFFALIIYVFWSEGDKLLKQQKSDASSKEVTKDLIKDIRNNLKESYEKRVSNKLATRFPINLQIKYSTEGNNYRSSLINKSEDGKTIRSTKIQEELITIFNKHNGRLLIVGKPGSGKTTLLLNLALELLERECQIPIIIDMITWRSRFSSVHDWLSELLPQIGFSKALTNQLLTKELLLPLFDGLDELTEKERPNCLEAIGKFGENKNIRYVICSRMEEYSQTEDAPVYCQIMVKPLTKKQINIGLRELTSPEVNGIIEAIKKDKLLEYSIQTPFYLNTLQLLFASGKSWEELGFQGESLEQRKKEIVGKFIHYTIGNLSNSFSNQGRIWLAFLAGKMNKIGYNKLELSDLQYNWSNWNSFQWFNSLLIEAFVADSYTLRVNENDFYLKNSSYVRNGAIRIPGGFLSFVVAFTGSLVFTISLLLIDLIFNQGLDPKTDYWDFLIKQNFHFSFIVSFLMTSFIMTVALIWKLDPEIKVTEIKKLNINDFLSGFFHWELWLLLYPICSILLLINDYISASEIVLLDIFYGINYNWYIFLLRWFFVYFFIPLLGPLGIGLILSFVRLFLKGNHQYYLVITHPYQSFLSSIRSFHFSILQHFHLRYLFFRKGLLPWHLVSFLQEATQANILESEGGSWRFRHKILQDYFANHWQVINTPDREN